MKSSFEFRIIITSLLFFIPQIDLILELSWMFIKQKVSIFLKKSVKKMKQKINSFSVKSRDCINILKALSINHFPSSINDGSTYDVRQENIHRKYNERENGNGSIQAILALFFDRCILAFFDSINEAWTNSFHCT